MVQSPKCTGAGTCQEVRRGSVRLNVAYWDGSTFQLRYNVVGYYQCGRVHEEIANVTPFLGIQVNGMSLSDTLLWLVNSCV
jgi:hypothetical protein